jgi:hypothetical protein
VFELVKRITGSAFYPSIADEYSFSEGMPFIRVADLGEFFVRQDTLTRIPEELVREMRQIAKVNEGDILVAKGGSIGGVSLVQPGLGRCATSRDVIAIETDSGKIDSAYLTAFLLSEPGQLQLERYKSQQVQAHLTFPAIGNVRIVVPDRQKQEVVAGLVRRAQGQQDLSKQLYTQAESLLVAELGLDKLDLSESLYSVRRVSEVVEVGRADAEYFQPKYDRIMAALRRSGQRIGDIVSLAKRRFEPQPGQPFSYIEISDLSGEGHAESQIIQGEDAPSRAQWIVFAGDVITSTVRPIRRLSAIVEPEQHGSVCSSGFAVLQVKSVEPELLLLYLRLPIVCEILDLYTTASMYPAISTADLLSMPITLPQSEAVREQLTDRVRASREARRDAKRLLAEAKAEVEKMIAEGSGPGR